MSKRLYVVHVEFEFAALVDSPEEARALVDHAMRDETTIGDDACVTEAKSTDYCLPNGWDGDGLVYGVDDDTTWDTAVAEEKAADEEAKRIAEFAAKQVSLPIE